MISRDEGQNPPGPLRLLQRRSAATQGAGAASWMVGTLFEGMHGMDGFDLEEHGDEQVILVMASLHLSDVAWAAMELGEGATPQALRRVYHDHMNPSHGMIPTPTKLS